MHCRCANPPSPWEYNPAICARCHGEVAAGEWHWFDRPEVQAQLDEAEANRREGRFTTHKACRNPRRRRTRYIAKGGIRK